MPRIIPIDWKRLVRIFEMFGCRYKRKEGSHHILTYSGAKRVVVVPEYKLLFYLTMKSINGLKKSKKRQRIIETQLKRERKRSKKINGIQWTIF